MYHAIRNESFHFLVRKALTGKTFLALFVATGCANRNAGPTSSNDSWARASLNATAWVQTSEEYRGMAFSAYNQAKEQLDHARFDPNWTALPEQEGKDIDKLPLAVILDVDETVLDNSAYQAWIVLNKQQYSPETWDNWCSKIEATSVAGSPEFIKYTNEKDVKIFYLTNRNFADSQGRELEPKTIKNLKEVNLLPDQSFSDGELTFFNSAGVEIILNNAVLMKNEFIDWGSDKTSRRTLIAQNYRVALLLGDSLGDF
ncbi:MAG TPA: hypothetical protein EYG38_16410, partial [Verrucomicrobia bacterium]|nr:hypothetical protein [Verrucomicrobiota bacterium]